MNRSVHGVAALFALCLLPSLSPARDFGVSLPTVQKGKFSSSLLYEHLKVRDDFDARGKSDFRSQVVGSQFNYGITELMGVSLKGGVLVDPETTAQGTRWQGRAGYLYGFDLYNQIFPATSVWPGVQVSGGVTGFHVPLNQTIDSAGTVTLIDQRMTGLDYHGSVLLSMRWGRIAPYGGLKIFQRAIDWRDNQPLAGQPSSIDGDAQGNVSLVLGVPIRINEAIQFQAEAILVNQTAITAGFTVVLF